MARTLEFFFDYGSPFSYLADTQVALISGRTRAELAYGPILLGAVYKATGKRHARIDPANPANLVGWSAGQKLIRRNFWRPPTTKP
jgi:2-hydroxychromene-2-carboxylate isomerase